MITACRILDIFSTTLSLTCRCVKQKKHKVFTGIIGVDVQEGKLCYSIQ